METENKQWKGQKNKLKFRIYEDQTRLPPFIEPKLMEFLINKFKKIQAVNPTMAKNHSIMVKSG